MCPKSFVVIRFGMTKREKRRRKILIGYIFEFGNP